MINALMNRSLGKKIEKLIDKSIKTNKSDYERKIDILAKTIIYIRVCDNNGFYNIRRNARKTS
jgi:hypothetical protein